MAILVLFVLNRFPMWLEEEFKDSVVCGIDEAGRGPLAGPCVVAGVVLPQGYTHPLINDSKQLSAKKRQQCLKDIFRDAIWINIITVSPQSIDTHNIYQATKEAMIRIAQFSDADTILTDAMPFKLANKHVFDYIKGDSRSISIAAASIVAKEVRDHLMEIYHHEYPMYGFNVHKGYPTKAHMSALNLHGPCPIHRRSYGPVADSLKPTLFTEGT